MKFLADFFPVILFFVAYKLYGIYAATAVAIAASFVQVGYGWLRHRHVENMHLITLGILVIFGGLTLVLQDRTFIMWKPSVINWLFGGVFLASLFIGEKPLLERMMGGSINVPSLIWRKLNTTWGLFFILLGFLNLYVANDFFIAEQALIHQTGVTEIDFDQCSTLFQSNELKMCLNAKSLEESWVNFKLFGMMGLTMVFIILQAFYLARHMRDTEEAPEEN
ncbi:MAG: septation protein A [Gammaproteobacteria bacterium (ex Lamellibrachia satsuma)]|nr:MAG: septation protein A [Gammaproteobacteria bacterium (ex Lamellibrachia satsuma)]RRS31091.1 MAG: septation protein A [Gammaproteobacteria bacterium (ex Lamellibrachia satsuma)]RRS36701.1 MAG: septation protein A [Gammaproteobacteria bacterium (ex Lamellibrachia satsuma)]